MPRHVVQSSEGILSHALGCPLHTEIGGLRWDPPGGFGMGCSACFQPVRLIFELFRTDFNDFEHQIDRKSSNFKPLLPFWGSSAFGMGWSAWHMLPKQVDLTCAVSKLHEAARQVTI